MVIAAAAAAALAAVAPNPCADLLAPSWPVSARPPRAVTALDLLQLRDVGMAGEGSADEPLFALSPDRHEIALALRRAMPASNSYCQALVVIDVATGHARAIDMGGELVRLTGAHGGVRAGFPSGVADGVTPSWSPDGHSVVVLKREHGITQAWRIAVDSGAATQLTHEEQDVTAVAWSADGERIIFNTDRALTAAQAAIAAEGDSGWRYDDRFFPASSATPYPLPSDAGAQVFALDLARSMITPATAGDRDELTAARSSSLASARDGDGRWVTIASLPVDPTAFVARRMLRFSAGQAVYTCRDDPCAKAGAFWLAADGRSVLMLARSGWGGGEQRFYRWAPAAHTLVALAATADLLTGCRPGVGTMLCARESATSPRRLVTFDPATGASQTLFDPNADYDRLRSGAVERLYVTSADGAQTFADVMLPPDYVAGRRYPMVVVQYQSRGFLRGGTGNEYPIPVLASAGMVVLSFQRPRDVAEAAIPSPRSFADFVRADAAHWADRRNVHTALIDAVDQAVARGWVDPRRIGITGLSDGVGTAAFALLHSHRFSVAALSGCCEEPINTMVLEGQHFAGQLAAAGYPPLSKPDPAFWEGYSVAQDADKVAAPLLIQAADSEYLLSLPTRQALREAGVPVELYVFPGEFHIKWQPAHRLAVWERALRWFQFWFDLPPLPGEASPPPGEAQRWQGLREHWHRGAATIDASHDRVPTLPRPPATASATPR